MGAEAPEGAPIGTIAYPCVLDRGGSLSAREASGSNHAVAGRITRGGGCVDGGTIRLAHDAAADTLGYQWFSPNDPVTARATAILTRQE